MKTPNSPGLNQSKSLDYIDAGRGTAILMVILVHVSQQIPNLNQWVRLACDYGQMGVQLFFVVSAYTLCYSMSKRSGDPQPIKSFYIRRFFRIAPLYYVAIVLYLSLHFIKQFALDSPQIDIEPYTATNILSNLSFTHGFVPGANNSIVPGGWSIGTEMAFYVLFPFVFSVTMAAKRRSLALWLLLILSICGSASFAAYLHVCHDIAVGNNSFFYYNIVNQFPVFVIGMLAYEMHEKGQLASISNPVSLLIFGSLTTASLILFHSAAAYSFIFTPIVSGFSFLFLVHVFRESANTGALLREIGKLSYSMYVFHFVGAFFLLRFVAKTIGGSMQPEIFLVVSFIAVVLLSFFIAKASVGLIENRGIKLGSAIVARIQGKRQNPA